MGKRSSRLWKRKRVLRYDATAETSRPFFHVLLSDVSLSTSHRSTKPTRLPKLHRCRMIKNCTPTSTGTKPPSTFVEQNSRLPSSAKILCKLLLLQRMDSAEAGNCAQNHYLTNLR